MKKFLLALIVGFFAIAGSMSMAMPANAAPAPTAKESKVAINDQASPLITNPGCDSSPELFYTVINQYGQAFCFANAGTMNVLIENVKTICPGNNRGQVEYVLYSNLNYRYWSTLRGPSGYGTCWNFDNPVRVTKVYIQ